jgi:hypothetical protein
MFNCIDSDLPLNLPKLTNLTITRIIDGNFLQV